MTAGGAPGARWGLTIPVGGVPLPAHADLVGALPSFSSTETTTPANSSPTRAASRPASTRSTTARS